MIRRHSATQYEALATYCNDRKEYSKTNDRQALEEKWGKYQKMYMNYMSDSYPSVAKIHIPQTFATTFRLHAAIMGNIRRNKEVVRFTPEPRHDQAAMESALAGDVMNQATSYYIAKTQGMKQISAWELEACTLGTSFMKTTWEYDEVEMPGRMLPTGEQLMEVRSSKDNLKMEHRPLYSIYFDPKVINGGGTIQDMEFLIDESYVSLDSLFDNEKMINKDAVISASRDKESPASNLDSETFLQNLDMMSGINMTGVEQKDKQSRPIKLDEYYGLVPRSLLDTKSKTGYDSSDLHDFVAAHVMLAEGVVVYKTISPYPFGHIPYDHIRCYPVPNYFFGMGIPELIKDLQRGMNATANQRIDNVSLAMNRMWMFRRGALNPKQLISRPGGFIEVKHGGPLSDSIQPLETADVTASSYMEQDRYDQIIQKVSGVADIFFGHTQPSEQSATEATFLTEMGAGMMEEVVANQVLDGFVPLMHKVRDYVQEFVTEPIPVNIDGQFIMVGPEELSGDFELVPTIGEQMFTKSAEMQKAMMLLQVTLGVEQQLKAEGKNIRISKILERIYDYAGWKDFNAIVTGAQAQGQAQGIPQLGAGAQGPAQLPPDSGGAQANQAPAGGGAGGVQGIEQLLQYA